MNYVFLFIIWFMVSAFDFNSDIKRWELDVTQVTARDVHLKSQLPLQQSVCQTELQQKAFPAACFQLLESLNQLNIKYQKNIFIQRVNKLCVDSVHTLTHLKALKSLNGNNILSLECRSALKKREKILVYKSEI